MKQIILGLLIIILLFSISTNLYPSIIWDGYLYLNFDNNINNDFSAREDIFGQIDLYIGQEIKSLPVFIWNYELYFEKFTKFTIEDYHAHNVNLLYRNRVNNTLLDLNLGGNLIFQINDPIFNYAELYSSGKYIKEWDITILTLAYKLNFFQFYKYNLLSSINNNPSIDIQFNFIDSTSFNLYASYIYRNYLERYVIDNEGYQTDERITARKINYGLSITQYISYFFQLNAGFYIINNDSNENLYFFGPEETSLILDNDEKIILDYSDYKSSNIAISILWNIYGPVVLTSGFDYINRKYQKRPPFNENDELKSNETLYEKITKFYGGLEYNITSYLTFTFIYSQFKDISNDYYFNGDSIQYKTGIKILF